MRSVLTEFRRALRGLTTQPAFGVSAILTLALGIGLTTAMFSVVDSIVLRPLRFSESDRLITICEQFPGASSDWCSISPPNVEDIAARSRSISAIGIARGWSYHLATVDGAEGINGGLATPGLFAALGTRPELGRLIERSDLLGRESDVALLTDGMWRSRFGGAPDVIGRTIVLDGKPVSIVGVLPASFELPQFPEAVLWRPLHIDPRDEQNRDWRGFVAYGLLAPTATLESARRELAGIAGQLRGEHFAATPGWGLTMTSLQDLVVGRIKPVLLAFLVAVSLVLVIACANVANLLLARAGNRATEMAVRSALGAARWRLIRGLLIESLTLALAGAVLGVLLALWGTSAFVALAPPNIPRIGEVRVDGRALAVALALACLTTVIFGLAPALQATRTDLARALREGARGSSRGGRLGRLLVVTELALALVLSTGAALLARSFAARAAWSPGFEREHLLTFTVFAPTEKFGGPQRVASLWQRLESELQGVPGVVAVGTASSGPLFGGGDGRDAVRFESASGPASIPAGWFDVSPGFFQTLGVPLVQGRALLESDRVDGPVVALVNETFARRFWPNESAVGKHVTMFDGRQAMQIVGVVRDVVPPTPGQPIDPEIYWSNRQVPRPFTYFLVRTAVLPTSVASAVRERVRRVDRDLEAKGIQTLSERLGKSLRAPRFQLLLLLTFSAAATLLAAIGTYGLFAYLVARRTRELGIRIALGARRPDIVAAVMRDALRLALLGTVIGIVGSLLLARTMQSMVAGVSTVDATSIAASTLLLLCVAAVAALAPAWRASRVDPVVALGAE